LSASESVIILRGGSVPIHRTGEIKDRDLLIRGGVIEAIQAPGSSFHGAADEARVVDAANALVVPGFVNAHTHSYGMLARNFGRELPLEPWMMYAWSITGGRTAEEVYLSALLQGVEALLTGTTTILDHLGGDVASTGEAARAYRDLGIRAAVAPMIGDIPLHQTVGIEESDWPAEAAPGFGLLGTLPAPVLLEQTRQLHRDWNGADDRITILAGPSAPHRCSADLLDGCAGLSSDLGMRVHTHLLESRVQAQDPVAGLQVLERHGLVNERLIGAHGVWLEPDDLARLGAAGSTLVHNPHSNLQLGSGIAQLGAWHRNGINAALGTDGANCGGSMDMLASMRLATILHRPGIADAGGWNTPWDALDMASIAGANAIGLERVGRVEVGWKADLAIFSMAGTGFIGSDDPVASLILSSSSSAAEHVIVDGRVVVEDGAVVGVDMAELAARAAEASRAIFARNAQRIGAVAAAQRGILADKARSAAPPRPVVDFVR
jgi:guanine deaminase